MTSVNIIKIGPEINNIEIENDWYGSSAHNMTLILGARCTDGAYFCARKLFISKLSENFPTIRSSCKAFVRCSDVGLDCNCVIFGLNEMKVMDEAVRN